MFAGYVAPLANTDWGDESLLGRQGLGVEQ
jgi:hypothetical protein